MIIFPPPAPDPVPVTFVAVRELVNVSTFVVVSTAMVEPAIVVNNCVLLPAPTEVVRMVRIVPPVPPLTIVAIEFTPIAFVVV